MERKLIKFLKALEQALPPITGHHSLTYTQYGDPKDRANAEDKLALGIRDKNCTILFLEDGDLEKPTRQLVDEVLKVYNEMFIQTI